MLERTTISGGAAIDAPAPSHARYQHLAYQPHIDGLRAVAVLGVIAFHAFPDWLPGGFVGVDVFFVISGYLICGIIFRSMEGGGFSFAEFYARRVRRIFPALILVLAAVLGFGWLGLMAAEYRDLGLNVAASAAFGSNLLLWGEAGYFAPDARLNPLLHLWSLGVEEQFYIIWPLVLWAAWRWRSALTVTFTALAASLALCLWLSRSDPVAAFYLPFARLWELQAGAVVAYFAPQLAWRGREAAAWSGAALLIAALLVINEGVAFPGGWALLPVAGAVFLIAAGPRARINRTALSHPAMVFIGLISYPLYLWHWPLLSVARIMGSGEPSPLVRLGLIGLAVMLAWATYHFIERPIRRGAPRPRMVAALAAALALAALSGLLVWRQDGLAARPVAVAYAEVSAALDDWTFPSAAAQNENFAPVVVVRGATDRYVAFLGDSHMEQYWPRLDRLYRADALPPLGAIFATFDGCPPFLDSRHRAAAGRYSCDAWAARAYAFAQAANVVKVVFGADWSSYQTEMPRPMADMLKDFGRAIAGFVASGKPVTVILDTPRGVELDPRRLLGNRWRLLVAERGRLSDRQVERRSVTNADLMLRIEQTARANGAAVVDPAEYLCSTDACPTVLDGAPLYLDRDHLRAKTARERATFMDAFVRE